VKQVTIDPIYHRDDHTRVFEKELVQYLEEVLFEPIEDILEVHEVRLNEEKEKEGRSALWLALLAGTVWYTDGVFTGDFNAAISKELRVLGARKTPSGFALEFGAVPLPLRSAINASVQRSQKLHEALINTLTSIAAFAAEAPSTGIPFTKTVDVVVDDLQEQFVETVAAKEDAPPAPQLPPGLKDRETRILETATVLALRDFIINQANQLRGKIRENLVSGARIDRLGKIVEAQLGVAKRKIHTVAEHGIAEVISDFREERYKDLGVGRYVWVTQHDERVRDDHRALEGKVFSWDEPPVTDRATGARNHPGQDYNCRCTARPILRMPDLP
jgi:SPP1 gp7 family putative phage head morphogenesis protein